MSTGEPKKSSTTAIVIIMSVGAVSLLLCLGLAFVVFGFGFFRVH
jgi:hypothetical protein